MRLTQQQSAVVADNHNLIWAFLHRHHLELDRYYGECATGLCKAAATYDSTRGTFANWACRIMDNEVKMTIRKNRREIPTTSLEREIADGLNFEDMLGEEQDLSGVEAKQRIAQILNGLGSRDHRIIQLLSKGRSQLEISRKMGVSQSEISRTISRIRAEYQKGEQR